MKILNSLILISLLLIGCQQQKSKETLEVSDIENNVQASSAKNYGLSTEELTDGFLPLFDGQTKLGWHVYNKQSDGTAWEVKDGVLFLNPQEIRVTPVLGAGDLTQAVDGGDLASDEEFSDFHLKMEWKMGLSGNSGLMFYVNESETYDYPWQTGPEIQIIDIDKECKPKYCPGDLYGLIAGPDNRILHKDWNHMEVISSHGELEVILNGISLYKIALWDDHWRKNISQTKFTNWPEFGTYKKGKIVLQDHGHKVWYRNIRIKNL